jgi:hypothetical protein
MLNNRKPAIWGSDACTALAVEVYKTGRRPGERDLAEDAKFADATGRHILPKATNFPEGDRQYAGVSCQRKVTEELSVKGPGLRVGEFLIG